MRCELTTIPFVFAVSTIFVFIAHFIFCDALPIPTPKLFWITYYRRTEKRKQ